MIQRLSMTIAAGLASALVWPLLPASANTFTHFPGPTTNLTGILNSLNLNHPAFETTATTFVVPGAANTNTTLNFTFQQDFGSFLFDFGFFPTASVTGIDPINNKQAWATAALASATSVFDDRNINPVATSTPFTLAAGTELGFFIVPNNTLANFNANPSNFYPSQTGNDSLRSPLFSISDANPGELDQVISFVGNGKTLFAFEDLTRTGATDNSFTDLVFTVDAELTPVGAVPEPLTILGASTAIAFGGFFKKRLAKKQKQDKANH